VVIPRSDQENLFRVILIVAFVLKIFDVIHLIFTQCSYDIFFIDWERPKGDAAQQQAQLMQATKKDDKADSRENELMNNDANKVSCWRTLFVANEWNEIQTFRKINPTVQLIFVLLFLKVVNLEALTTSDCNTKVTKDINDYQAPYSGILRVAMAASMYLGVGLAQYLIYIFLYIRCIDDRIGEFIDFCSVSNISMFIMTHTQFGYYIHGRSPLGNADTSMQQMTQALLREQSDITAKRGLEQGSNQQNFSIFVSNKLSKQYAKVLKPTFEVRRVVELSQVFNFENLFFSTFSSEIMSIREP
jgi:meckelin